MNRAERIKARLNEKLSPQSLELVDDSARHAGHAGASPGGETHYRLTVVSEAFAGLSRVARHQLVYGALAEEFKTGLHALNITASVPGEN